MTVEEEAQGLLEQALGSEATFRPQQFEAIRALVEQRGRVLVVQRTGWGKSIVYFIATRVLRGDGLGPTILISPLLALMRDQVTMAEKLGVRARSIDSSNRERWDEIEAELIADEVDLLLVSPERLANQRFTEKTVPAIPKGIGMFVVDEAHCISDWGHDFRPDFLRIRSLIRHLPPGVPLLATTATANNRVITDVEGQLGPDLEVFRGALARKSLHLQVIELSDQAERLAWLAMYLDSVEASGIVYTLTVRDAIRVSAWLKEQGIDAPPYFGSLGNEERLRLERALRNNEVKALVATVALGMGFDKPDLAFVVHFQRPTSVVAYYQQIGRAGRGIDRAEVVLLTGREDDEIAEYFISGAFPPEQMMRDVLSAVEDHDSVSVKKLETMINARHGEIDQALKILEVEDAVVKQNGGWSRTVNRWEADHERIEKVTATRYEELERMQEYADTGECLMLYLTKELDDPAADRCRRCANCTEPFLPVASDPELVQEAIFFLKRAYRPIEPRKQWPPHLGNPRGNIPQQHRLEEGWALAIYGDAGWGRQIREGKAEGAFSDELVEAVAAMIENDLRPGPAPTWVTSVPSKSHPELVPDFARRLADHLDLPYREALAKSRDTAPQKQMENNVQQARNVLGAFAAQPTEIMEGPVFLVDDMVDSRWSLTVCGVVLREGGSGPVYPIALGETTAGGGG
ncbi:MAG TPA: RecQ family ATP-dependent DNA helicase [Solirubrobacterales bacterium]|nr:RecQ family ATP-dependent DNA helicase [Solirubrobacterales bacterium]